MPLRHSHFGNYGNLVSVLVLTLLACLILLPYLLSDANLHGLTCFSFAEQNKSFDLLKLWMRHTRWDLIHHLSVSSATIYWMRNLTLQRTKPPRLDVQKTCTKQIVETFWLLECWPHSQILSRLCKRCLAAYLKQAWFKLHKKLSRGEICVENLKALLPMVQVWIGF